jgi:hypothetical protein
MLLFVSQTRARLSREKARNICSDIPNFSFTDLQEEEGLLSQESTFGEIQRCSTTKRGHQSTVDHPSANMVEYKEVEVFRL